MSASCPASSILFQSCGPPEILTLKTFVGHVKKTLTPMLVQHQVSDIYLFDIGSYFFNLKEVLTLYCVAGTSEKYILYVEYIVFSDQSLNVLFHDYFLLKQQ